MSEGKFLSSTSRNVVGLIHEGVTCIYHRHNPSGGA